MVNFIVNVKSLKTNKFPLIFIVLNYIKLPWICKKNTYNKFYNQTNMIEKPYS